MALQDAVILSATKDLLDRALCYIQGILRCAQDDGVKRNSPLCTPGEYICRQLLNWTLDKLRSERARARGRARARPSSEQ